MSSLRVQLPWQRSGPGVGTTRRHSRVNAAIFLQQQLEESVEDEDDDQQLRLEVPRLVRRQTGGDVRQRGDHPRGRAGRGARGGGGAGPREGDLDVMSATSTALGHVPRPTTLSSQRERERRAQIDSCWCNIPDMFVDPASRAAYYWMALVTMAVVYNWIVIILRVAFEDMRDSDFHQNVFRVLDTISDVIYLMDVAIQSRTAYLEDGCLVKSLPETVRHYRSQPFFALDVLSVVPVTTLFFHLSMIGLPCPFESGFNSLTTPGLRILRLLKYPSMTRFFEKTDSRTNNPNLLRAFRLSLHLWLVIHWIGCFYYLLSQYEGLGSNDWVYPNSTEFSPFSRKYIFCMYWSTMTLTTIGERPWPVTDVEYIFTGLTFLIGVFVFAAVVGNVGDVISNMNAARHDFQARMDQIKFYLNHRNVPEHLQEQIRRWAEYTWARTKAIDEHSVLQLLPSRLRTEVAIHVHLKTLKKVRIFEQCEEGLLRELVLKLRPSIYSPGEYICRIGEIGREMYIIDHGKVEILFPEHGSGQMKQVAIMMPGNYFGEISLLKLDEGQNKRTADVRSIGFSELLCLSRRDLMAALMEYPEAKKILEAQARQRMQQTKRPPNEAEADSPLYPGVPEAGSSLGGAGLGTGRRSARAIFAQVMRQEGFSKLLANTASEEIAEMKRILKELREIKSQLPQAATTQQEQQGREVEGQLQRGEDLQQIRTQLLLHTRALVTPPSTASLSTSTLTNTADLSSDTSTLTSPSVAQSALQSPPSHSRQTAAGVPSSSTPLKLSTQCAPSERIAVLPGVMSEPPKHSARVVKAMSPFGCSVPPQDLASSLSLLSTSTCSSLETPTQHTRRRRSSSRVSKSSEKDQRENADRLMEGAQDTSTVLAVAQGGGGDEPAMAAVEKDSPMKDEISAKRSASSTDNCKDSLSAAASLGPAFESHSSFEFYAPGRQHVRRPTELGASSEQLRPLAHSDSFKSLASGSNTSSYTTASYSTTSSSSGGRGHSPKPAKPRPRYRREEPPENCTHTSTNKEMNIRCPDEFPYGELGSCSNVMIDCRHRADSTIEGHVSSEGFSTVSMCSSLDFSDSGKSPNMKVHSSCSETSFSAADKKDVPTECTTNKHNHCPLEIHTETEKNESGLKTVTSDTVQVNDLSELDKEDLSTECTVGTFENIRDINSSHETDRAEEQISSQEEQDLTERTCTNLDSKPANQTENVSPQLEMVDAFEKDLALPAGDDGPEDTSAESDDSDADSKSTFIAATRVKSDFDKRISEKELADMPRPVTCQKIDDAQLSILLAKRREVNDSADYVVESHGKVNISSVGVKNTETNVEHSHSVHSVVENATMTGREDQSPQRTQRNFMPHGRKQTAGGTADSIDVCQASEKDEPSSTLTPSKYASENRSHSAKTEFSEVPAVPADLHWQSESTFQDVVYSEDLVTEHRDSAKSDETETAVHARKDSKNENDERLNACNKQRYHTVEDEGEVDRAGTDHSAQAVGLHIKGEVKEKTYPVSILKKPRPETKPGRQDSCTNGHSVQHSDCPNTSPPTKNSGSPSASLADSCHGPHVPPNARKYLDTDTLAENSVGLSSECVNKETHYANNNSDSKQASVEYESSSGLSDSELHLNKALQRSHSKEAAVEHNLPVLEIQTDQDQDTLIQPARMESHSKTDPFNVSDGTRDMSSVISSAKAMPQEPIDEKENEKFAAFSRQYSPPQYCRQSLEKGADSTGTVCVDPIPCVPRDEVSAVSTPRPSDTVSSNPTQSARRHSEKLDSLIAAFDNGVKRCEKGNLRHGAQKNNIVSLTETKTASHLQINIGLASEEPTEKDKANLAEDKVNDSFGDSRSSVKTGSPTRSAVETENEAKRDNSSSLPPGLPTSPTQKRKVLRRRSMAKRFSNPCDGKEGACNDNINTQSSAKGTDAVSIAPNAESKQEGATAPQEPPTEDITTCITLVKNLVWEMKSDEKPPSAVHDTEAPSSQAQEKVNCSSGSVDHDQTLATQRCSTVQASSVGASSKLLFGSGSCMSSDEVGRGEDFCVDESPPSDQVEVPDSSMALSGSDTVINAREETANMDKSPPFKDEIKETIDYFRSDEALDKANNSTVTCSHYLLCSSGSSPTDCMIPTAVRASHLHSHSADLVCPDIAVTEHVCFEAPYDMNQITPSCYLQALSATDDLATECHDSNCSEEVDSMQWPRVVMQNRNQPTIQGNFSTPIHSSTVQRQMEVAAEEAIDRGRELHSDTLARTESRFHQSIEAGGHGDTESSDITCPQHYTAGCDTGADNDQNAESSDYTHPVDPEPDNATEAGSGVPDQGQPAETTPEAEHTQHQGEQNYGTSISLLQEAPQGMPVPDSPAGSGMVQALHLHPSLLDSPGASSTDDSTGEGEREGEAEAVGSLILLADFGVEDDDDDEGALSGLSGCDDHSDINSDLDDL